MPRNHELDLLKSEEQQAFERKQAAWERYAELRDRCSEAHEVMESSWDKRVSAKEKMNEEFEAMQQASENYSAVWDEYARIRDETNRRIEGLRTEADYEHQQMQECYDKASNCYEFGDRSEAPYWSGQGREHKERRDSLNQEVKYLCEDIKRAKQDAQSRAPKTDSSVFHSAKQLFEMAKRRHESAQQEFKRLKAARDEAKAEFDAAQEAFKRAKASFQRKLEEVKLANARERERILDKAGVSWSERGDAKIIKKTDGSTQVYHGGLGSGDGLGHGHTALDVSEKVTYDRDAFAEHGRQNFVDDSSGWAPIQRGSIEGHEVTFRQGTGKNKGQTIICDGHVSGKELSRHHNHYGDNDKTRYPDEPDRIEDSSKHKNDSYYNGPGH